MACRKEAGVLGYHETDTLLAAYGIPAVSGFVADDPKGAAEKFPLAAINSPEAKAVIKLLCPSRTHKSDAGLVRLGIASCEEARKAAEAFLAAVPDPAEREGILLQPMMSGGIELILGAQVDPQFGPLVALGPGGILVELLGGADFLKAPFSRGEARAFIERNPSWPLLKGFRGKAEGDIPALIDAIECMGALISEKLSEIVSVDINPLAVFPAGAGVLALDARIERREG